MEVGEKLKELNMTVDETDRLIKAFKDEKFRELLRDYAQEISDPENKKRYEEEIKLLEQERGNSIEFIHPKPFRALKTSVNGKQKCFINICANDKVGKPECKCGVSEDGRTGQRWSLPHSLHPGRQDTDPKGNAIKIYDVIFHPDTLHIASKNKRFMDMVDSTAIQGIQNAFKVTLDKNNVREMNTKYKGTPLPCVIRKPIPGYKAKEPSEKPDPLAFPYPDEKRPNTSSETRPTDSPATKDSSDAKPKSVQIQPRESNEPTKPNYTVKYRSFVDLQDFRCSRDSARSPRPKEIVVIIDMPLLKSVTDTSLEVKEKSLLLDSKEPAYRLELPLAYPVDEDKGEAKFNKQRGQLTVTLPVLPSEAFHFATGPATTVSDAQSVGDDEGTGRENEEDKREERERGSKKGQEEQRGVEEKKVKEEREVEEQVLKQQTRVEKDEDEGEEQMRKGQEGVDREGSVVDEEEKWKKQEREGEKSKEVEIVAEKEAKWKKQNSKGQESVEDERRVEDQKRDKIYESGVEEEETWKEQKQESEKEDGKVIEKQNILITAEHSCGTREEREVELNSCLESTPKMKTSDIQETEKTKENVHGKVQPEADSAFLNQTSSEESHTAAAAAAESPPPAMTTTSSHDIVEDRRVSQGTEGHATVRANESSRGVSDSGKQEEREDMDEDDLTTEQIFQIPEHDNKPPPALLREIDKDGNETVISDHSTSAGFIFQSTLMFELD
ncbi:protein kintoun [Xiphias gladius]|uniref:protein kintoun n=1 Tax=Xiphias gladius TaxID=8245 RepID=UPI001A99D6A3|nr:protein kintoun [Xiphias gladius]